MIATFHSNIVPCITYTEYLYLRPSAHSMSQRVAVGSEYWLAGELLVQQPLQILLVLSVYCGLVENDSLFSTGSL